jgi:hypothetical protein
MFYKLFFCSTSFSGGDDDEQMNFPTRVCTREKRSNFFANNLKMTGHKKYQKIIFSERACDE